MKKEVYDLLNDMNVPFGWLDHGVKIAEDVPALQNFVVEISERASEHVYVHQLLFNFLNSCQYSSLLL